MRKISSLIFEFLEFIAESDSATATNYVLKCYRKRKYMPAYASILQHIRVLEKLGLIKSKKKGRKRILTITPKGREESKLLKKSILISKWKTER